VRHAGTADQISPMADARTGPCARPSAPCTTVAAGPTLRNVAVLGVIVLIRTFLSVSLQVEIDGRVRGGASWRAEPRPGIARKETAGIDLTSGPD
jgi:uncharacterized protein DUF1622